jgi:ankyrin
VKNASVKHVTNNGLTTLDIACRKNRIDTVKLLLAHDINIQKTTSPRFSSLHIACENKNTLLVGLLLIYGADANQSVFHK